MANYLDSKCSGCPYRYVPHLIGTQYNFRHNPLSKENNGSQTLIVLQSPGVEEWRNGAPLQPTVIKGGSAGRRISLSWDRVHHTRTDYDITNAVQCFQGNIGNRDLPIDPHAVSKCLEWLKDDIVNGNYTRIIAFGDIAFESCSTILSSYLNSIILDEGLHPNGGLRRTILDAKW